MLDLLVVDYIGESQWTWRLLDESGNLLAEHRVRLDPGSTDLSLLMDLYGNRWRLPPDPEQRAAEQQRLLDRVSDYAAAQVLGDVGRQISERTPVTVRVVMPPTAEGLLAMPLELARWPAGSLADQGTVFCYGAQSAPEPSSGQDASARYVSPPDGDADRVRPLRVLAVFALPETSSALGLVKERRVLEQLMRAPIVRGDTPIELTILQYGATRKSVMAALADPGGWDIVHLAGHGGPGRFYLERSEGGGEPVETSELVGWLAPLRGRVRLVTLSACESGVAGAARILGVPATSPHRHAAIAIPSLGYEIASALDCTVLATRYPVDDRFSVAFIRRWYEALLQEALTVSGAMRVTLPGALRAAPWAPLAAATFILLGAADLRLVAPSRSTPAERLPAEWLPAERCAAPAEAGAIPPVPERFIGRTVLIRDIGAWLGPESGHGGLAVLGVPGIGKTAACAEAAERYQAAFSRVAWHRAERRDTVKSLVKSLTRTIIQADSDTAEIVEIVESIRRQHVLVVIDNVQNLMTTTGAWRDSAIGAMIAALMSPGASSRVLLISDTPIPDSLGVPTLVVTMMSRSESEWLIVELAEEHHAPTNGTSDVPGDPGRVPWLICRGHPGLIEYCNTGDGAQDQRRQRRLWYLWEVFGPLAPARAAARRPLGRRHPGALMSAWAAARAEKLSAPARRALAFLSVLEQADRDAHWAGYLWDALASELGAVAGDFDAALAELAAIGLAEPADNATYLIHPAVAHVGRLLDEATYQLTTLAMLTGWRFEYQGQLAQSDGGNQGALAYCAASEVPYLMRMSRWEEASAACERAISHDNSPKMAARLAPYAVEIVHAAGGTPLETKARFVHAVLAADVLPGKGIEHFRDLLERAAAGADQTLTLVAAHSLAASLARSDPLAAQHFLELAIKANAGEPFGPWLQIQLDSTYADILDELGAWPDALAKAEKALAGLAELENSSEVARGVISARVRLSTLVTAAEAAARLGLSERAAAYQADIRRQSDNLADRSLADTQFNDIGTYISQGDLDYAEQLLRAALTTFTEPGDSRRRGLALSDLALVEHRRGKHDDAVDLARQALRASYHAGQPPDAAAAHGRLAGFLAASSPPAQAEAPAHVLAAAAIQMRVSGQLIGTGFTPVPATSAFTLLALCQYRQPQLIPASQAELAGALRQTTGIDIDVLLNDLERIPVRPGTHDGTVEFTFNGPAGAAGDTVTDVLCFVQRTISPAWIADIASWQPSIETVIAAAQHKPGAMVALYQHTDQLAGAGWGTLAREFLRFATDPTGFVLGEDLHPIEASIMRQTAETFRELTAGGTS